MHIISMLLLMFGLMAFAVASDKVADYELGLDNMELVETSISLDQDCSNDLAVIKNNSQDESSDIESLNAVLYKELAINRILPAEISRPDSKLALNCDNLLREKLFVPHRLYLLE